MWVHGAKPCGKLQLADLNHFFARNFMLSKNIVTFVDKQYDGTFQTQGNIVEREKRHMYENMLEQSFADKTVDNNELACR